ncbi:GtrA family protein [Rhizobium paknamense]|uniref:Flippase GtrA n=1 Tax=Rhizobium paknamense TaxID=1206817 RepID=A0ABU0ICY5_9HYPH|nr:GtrA family protein [Rhizobium paknamense]MDQ0455542.1 putative flippase GtrA [Rhizobium paknamense]
MKRLIRFGMVGFLGFIVDAGTLLLLLKVTPLGPLLARAIAIALALFVTWQCNRVFTFGASKRSLVVEGFRYGSVGLVSALINYTLYCGLLLSLPLLQPLAALVLASAAATTFSFFGYSRFVFRG